MRLGPYYAVMKLNKLILRDCDALAIFNDAIELVVSRSDYKMLKNKIGKYVGIGYYLEYDGE